MALTLENALRVKQKATPEIRKPAQQSLLRTLFSHIAQHRANPDLQFVAVTGLNSADLVVAGDPCRLYALLAKKPTASTTDAWLKGSDHATVAAANGDIVLKFVGTGGGGQELAAIFPDGMLFNTGLTLGCHTTVNGNTDSASADAVNGFAIIGAQ